MLKEIRAYYQEVVETTISSKNDVFVFKKRFFSKQGVLNSLFSRFKKLSKEEKKLVGKDINLLKGLCQKKINSFNLSLVSNKNTVLK